MTSSIDRISQMYAWERRGVLSDVSVRSTDKGRFFTFVIAKTGEARNLRAGELDGFLAGLDVGYAAVKPEPEPAPPPKK